jgi:uncharacterized protein (DUF433 family)
MDMNYAATTYSPQEAAAVSGAPLAAIQKAITMRKIPARVTGTAKRRQLDETALLAFALVAALPASLRLSLGAAYQLLRQMASGSDASELVIGEVVRIDAGKALAAARRCLALYDRARQIIVSNPAIMGGMPTIPGTRVTAQSILGRLEGGDSVESVLEDYPYLDRDAVEAAALYAKANPPRGRPGGKLWRRAS